MTLSQRLRGSRVAVLDWTHLKLSKAERKAVSGTDYATRQGHGALRSSSWPWCTEIRPLRWK